MHAVGGRLLALTRDAPADQAGPRMLVLRALGVGDFLTGIPAYRALRRVFPTFELTLAAPPELAPLAELAGVFDRLLPARGLAPLRWAHTRPPEIAVNLHGRGPQSHWLLQALRPTHVVAFACPDGGSAGCPSGPGWRANEHEVTRWCRLLRAHGVDAAEYELDLPVPELDSPAPGAVVIHPGAGSASRRWPAERFAEVARSLRDVGHQVVISGSAAEKPLSASVASAAGPTDPASGDLEVLAGRLNLKRLAALVARARLVISGDTGVAHLATAYRRPSVVLFGPTPPSLWGPPPRAQHMSLWKGAGTGDPHGSHTHPALLRIDVPEVLDAASRALSAEEASDAGEQPSFAT